MPFVSSRVYILSSVALATAVIYHAFATREQFYPSMVYLSSSKLSVAVLGNLGFAAALATYKLLTRVFLGRLRDSEVERINDKISQAIVETCLAMTVFREDFTFAFISMFVALSFVKVCHWLVQDRVDFMETAPDVSRLAHLRITAFMGLLLAIDLTFLHLTLTKTVQHGVSVHLLFAFEYAVLASTITTTAIKYCLTMVDMALEGRWEGKGVAVFYLELTLDLLHLMVYCAFFAIVFSTYGIPLHLVRDLYFTFRNFQIRVRDFLRYRRITANMDQRLPDASEEDLARADHVCIICREEMAAGGHNKRLSCSHCFHLHCLRSWLERQQNCPICRAAVAPPQGGPQLRPPPPLAPQRGAPGDAAAAAAAPPARPEGAAGAGAQRQDPAAGGNMDALERARAALQFQAAGAPPPPRGRHAARRAGGAPPDAAAAAAAAAGLPAGFGPPAYLPPGWVPAPSMAMFVPGGLPPAQFAANQTPEQQQAAAAAAAAATMSGVVPLLPVMLPPAAFPGAAALPAGGAAAGAQPPSAEEASIAAALAAQQHATAAAATAAVAAAMLNPHAPAMLPVAPPGSGEAGAAAVAAMGAAMQAAADAMGRVLAQQMEALQAYAQRIQQHDTAAGGGGAAASSSAAAGGGAAPAAPAAAAAPATPAPDPAPASPEAPAASSADLSSGQEDPQTAAASQAGGDGDAAAGEDPTSPGGEDEAAAELRRRRLERFGA
eukprot:scaffold14.g1286.t1